MVCAAAGCGPTVVRVDAPAVDVARSMILLVETELGAAIAPVEAHAIDLASPTAIPPLDADEPLRLTVAYYSEPLDVLGLDAGKLRAREAGRDPGRLSPALRTLHRRVDGDAEDAWAEVEFASTGLPALEFAPTRPRIEPRCQRAVPVFEGAIDATERPILAHVLADGRALVLTRGGFVVEGREIEGASALVRLDPRAKTVETFAVPPGISLNSAAIDRHGVLWLGGRDGHIRRGQLDLEARTLALETVTSSGSGRSIHWIDTFDGRDGETRVFAVEYGERVLSLDRASGRLVEIGRIDAESGMSDKGDLLALDEDRVALALATHAAIVIHSRTSPPRALPNEDPSRGFMSLIDLGGGVLVAGGSDASLTFHGDGPPRLHLQPNESGQWIRALVALGGGRFWWGGKVGKGGQFDEGAGFCAPQDIARHNVRQLVRWESGLLVTAEGTGAGSGVRPTFAFLALE